MGATIFEEAAAEFLSVMPEEFVTHVTNAKRELLLSVKSCVGECVDDAIQTLDLCVELSKQKRGERAKGRADGERVTIEEEDETEESETEQEEGEDGEEGETDGDSAPDS